MKPLLAGLGLLILAGGSVATIAGESRIDVAHIIDQAAAEAILEEPVKAPSARNVDGTDGYYSKCNYYSTDAKKRLIIRVYQAGSGVDPQKELEAVAETSGTMRAISGLGDKARVTSGIQGGLPNQVVMIYVIKGNSLITIGLGGFEDENAATDKLKAVAQKIIAKL
jgi:hypothetical protein